jgi:hypothetical protein
MSSGLYSGVSGIALGVGLYKGVSGLWSGASGLIAGFDGFSPLSLFAAGEQGYWLDPSDFSTMFQDAAGTTPVTAVGQSVRLMLDKSGRGNTFTQANVANAPLLQQDTSGRYFLLFDGSDDWLQSAATINPGAVDKVQVFAGVRKLSDAATGAVLESSSNPNSNNGVIDIQAPSGAAANYRFGSRGTVGQGATSAGFPAPSTNVLTGLGDISGDSVILRVNGTQAASSTADQGTGNYLTYTHFIGRRAGTALPFNGRLYQMITRFGANLTADQIAATETFVNQRTGAY